MSRMMVVSCCLVVALLGCVVSGSRYLPTKRSWGPDNDELMGLYREEMARRAVPAAPWTNYPLMDNEMPNMDEDYPLLNTYGAARVTNHLAPDYVPRRFMRLR